MVPTLSEVVVMTSDDKVGIIIILSFSFSVAQNVLKEMLSLRLFWRMINKSKDM